MEIRANSGSNLDPNKKNDSIVESSGAEQTRNYLRKNKKDDIRTKVLAPTHPDPDFNLLYRS